MVVHLILMSLFSLAAKLLRTGSKFQDRSNDCVYIGKSVNRFTSVVYNLNERPIREAKAFKTYSDNFPFH